MKIYFDMCSLQRPFDDKSQLRVLVEAEADFFCTCDDRFLKKARSLNTAPTKVLSPLELVSEIQP